MERELPTPSVAEESKPITAKVHNEDAGESVTEQQNTETQISYTPV